MPVTWVRRAAFQRLAARRLQRGHCNPAGARVSRLHAKISWRAGKFYIEDVSSYGTWVRFAASHAVIDLRRQEVALLIEGEIALGAPFEDFTVPTVSFTFPAASKQPGRR